MKTTVVLDASAVLAFLQDEPGATRVFEALENEICVVSAANQAEIISKALDHGLALPAVQKLLADLNYLVVDTTVADGIAAGAMRLKTRQIGLSLGDRLCLALGQRLEAAVLTADRSWVEMAKTLNIHIHNIRS